jgi:dihydroflavonol-4-reductase
MGGGRVLVTGGTGFVGSAVLRALLTRGYGVRALVRLDSARSNLADLDCEIAEGDMTDRASILRAMQGVQFVFHVAGDYRLWARNPEEIVRNNVDGTRAVMGAALQSGVERVVYTSSVAVLKPIPGMDADETSRMPEREATGAYKKSKIAAHALVEAMIARDGLPAVIVSPSTPIGPRDIKPTPTGRIIVNAAKGRVPAFVDTGLNLVHVDDVAEGHVLALERGKPGGHYILGGQDVTLRAMLASIADCAGLRAPRIQLPRAPIYPLALAAEITGRLTGRTPFLTLDGLRMSKHHMFFSSAKAARELGYTARPFEAGLRDAISWFRNAGYLH